MVQQSHTADTIFMVMERNYDEIISEMLRQLDRHSEQLEAQIRKSDEQWVEQRRINAELFAGLKELGNRQDDHAAVMNQNQAMALQTAAILNRIIKVNKLKL